MKSLFLPDRRLRMVGRKLPIVGAQPPEWGETPYTKGKSSLQSYVCLGSNVCSRILKRMFALAQIENNTRTMVQGYGRVTARFSQT